MLAKIFSLEMYEEYEEKPLKRTRSTNKFFAIETILILQNNHMKLPKEFMPQITTILKECCSEFTHQAVAVLVAGTLLTWRTALAMSLKKILKRLLC